MTFILEDEIRKANAAYFNALVAAGHIELPVSIQDVEESLAGWPFRKPPPQTSGPCVHCGYEAEDRRDGEWLHDECNDILIAEQEADYRADDPRRGQAKWINR